MLASHLYSECNSPTWHQYHQVPFQKRGFAFGCLSAQPWQASWKQGLQTLSWSCAVKQTMSSAIIFKGCTFNEGQGSSLEHRDDWGGACTLHHWGPQNNWQAEINQFVYFLSFPRPLWEKESPHCLWEDEPKKEVNRDGCILGTLIPKCKIFKN